MIPECGDGIAFWRQLKEGGLLGPLRVSVDTLLWVSETNVWSLLGVDDKLNE